MPRLVGGFEGRARIGSLLRTTGLVAGILLGAGGVWVLVTSDSTKDTRIGALLGIWGIFLAATVLIGRREHDVVEAGGELVVRGATGLDTVSDARAVREYEQRLQAMLRHEIQQTLGAELAALRAEVASLRSEVVEKVGGELRLERIETTRVIGSDIEALQREVRQLKSARFDDDDDDFAASRPSPRPALTVDAAVVETARPAAPAAPRPPAPTTSPAPTPAPTPAPAPARPAPPQPFVPPAPPAPAPAPAQSPQPSQPIPPVSPPVAPAAPAAPAAPPALPRPVAPVQRRDPIPPVELTAPVPLLRDLSVPTERPQQVGAPEPLVPGVREPAPAPEPAPEPERPAQPVQTASVSPETFVTGSYWQGEAERHSAPVPRVFSRPEPEPAPEPAPERAPEPATRPWSPAPAPVEPASESTSESADGSADGSTPAPAQPAAAEIDPNDPFASLPRIRPFTEFDLDPIEAPATPVNYAAARHASDAPDPGRSGGGRRRRDDDEEDDVLSRILQRERGN